MELIEEDSETLSRKVIIEYLRIQFGTNRGKFKGGEKSYTDLAESFFDNAIRGLSCVINNKIYSNWVNPDALWFYEALTDEEIIHGNSPQKVREVIARIRKSRKRLELFIKNPEESKASGNTQELAKFVEKLYTSYPDKLYDSA